MEAQETVYANRIVHTYLQIFTIYLEGKISHDYSASLDKRTLPQQLTSSHMNKIYMTVQICKQIYCCLKVSFYVVLFPNAENISYASTNTIELF